MQQLYSFGLVFFFLFVSANTSLATPASKPHRQAASRPYKAQQIIATNAVTKQLKVLFSQLKQPKWRPRYDATQAIGKMGLQKGWKVFGASAKQVHVTLKHVMMTDKDFWVRAGAAKAFGLLGSRGVLDLVMLLKKDKQAEVRHAAIEALERIGTVKRKKPFLEGHQKQVFQALKALMGDRSVQFTAAKALEKLTGDPRPLVELSIRTILYGSQLIRGLVSLSFRTFSPRAKAIAIPLLIEALAQTTSQNEADVIGALIMTGKMAIPTLRKALKHPSLSVRKGAKQALQKLSAK